MLGLLSEPQEKDGSIAELLERVETTRLKLQKAKAVKKPKAMPPITPDEIPFDFPSSWKLVRLSDVAWFGGGHTPSMSDASNFCNGGMLWVTSKDMKVDRLTSTQITLTEKGASTLTRYPAGTVLMVTRSGILRRKLPVAILEREATVNQDQKAIVPFEPDMAEWLFVYLRACDSFIRHNFGKTGATVESIIFDRVKELPIAIPTLAEQKRIVNRIEELLAQISIINEAQREYFHNYYELRKKVIEAGIRGELTQCLPEDGNAEELLKQIQGEKNELVRRGKLRRQRASMAITEADIPFTIPETWKWVRFGDLISLTNGLASRGTQGGKPHPVLRLADLTSAGIDSSDVRMIELSDTEYASHIVNKNDLIFIRVNGSRGKVGKAFLFTSDQEVSYCDHLFCGHRFSNRINPEYILLICLSDMAWRQIDPFIKTTAGQNTISQGNMARMLIPLPPEAEQNRIVERVKEILQALPNSEN